MATNQPAKKILSDLCTKHRDKGYSQGYEAGKEDASDKLRVATNVLKTIYIRSDDQTAMAHLIDTMGEDAFEAWAKKMGVL